MKITVITLFPKMITSFFEESIVKRAIEKKLIDIEVVNLRNFAKDSYGTVDGRPYGGGAGMVLRVDVLSEAVRSIVKSKNSKVVLTSAKGVLFNQQKAQEYSKLDHLILLAGHYEGVDERALDFIDEEISMGDFVLTGGEIAAAAIVDAVSRLIPGTLKKQEATEEESFYKIGIAKVIDCVGEQPVLLRLREKGHTYVTLLEYPQYTRPDVYEGKKVPDELLSGNPKIIEKWNIQKAFEETLKKRPDLLQ